MFNEKWSFKLNLVGKEYFSLMKLLFLYDLYVGVLGWWGFIGNCFMIMCMYLDKCLL